MTHQYACSLSRETLAEQTWRGRNRFIPDASLKLIRTPAASLLLLLLSINVIAVTIRRQRMEPTAQRWIEKDEREWHERRQRSKRQSEWRSYRQGKNAALSSDIVEQSATVDGAREMGTNIENLIFFPTGPSNLIKQPHQQPARRSQEPQRQQSSTQQVDHQSPFLAPRSTPSTAQPHWQSRRNRIPSTCLRWVRTS